MKSTQQACTKSDEKRFTKKAKRLVGKVPFIPDLVAAYFAVLDSQTPKWVKALLCGAIAYFLLPSDVIPDLFAGLGYTDDAAVIAGTMKKVGKHVTPEHRLQARDWLGT